MKGLEALRARIDENERKKTTAAMVPLEEVRESSLQYPVNRTDYDTYADIVKGYTQDVLNRSAEILPETAGELEEKIRTEGRTLGAKGTTLRMYAGGNGLDQSPITRAAQDKLQAEMEANKAITLAKRYQTATDYILGEKTSEYKDYESVMAKALGDQDALKRAVAWGANRVDKGTAATTEAAARNATDAQLEEMLKTARTEREKQIIKAEMGGRTEQRTEEQEKIWGPSEEKKRQLAEELVDINVQINYGGLSEHDRNELEARKQEIYDALKLGESPEVQAYRQMQAADSDVNFAERYVRENTQRAQDWTAASNGGYTGDDAEIRAFSDKYNETEEAWYDAMFEAQNSDSPQAQVEAQMRAQGLLQQMEAMEAEAQEKAQAAQEALDAIKEAQHGEGSVGRLAGAFVQDTVYQLGGAAGKAIATVAKPFELLGRLGVNLVTGSEETVGQAINEVASGNGFFSTYEKNLQATMQRAQEEAYHARKALTDSPAVDVAYEIVQNIVEMAPDILMNYATAGGMTAADAAVRMQNAVTDYMGNMSASTIQKVAQNAAKNPGFYTSLVREWSSDMEEAREAGVPAGLAEAMGTLTALVNAAIEVGGDGGIQSIGKPDADGWATQWYQNKFGKEPGRFAQIALGALDAGPSEGLEEVTQGITQRGMQAVPLAAAGENVPIISFTPGDNAVVNVPDLAKEGILGAAVGGIMGAGGAAIDGARTAHAEKKAEDLYQQQMQAQEEEAKQQAKDELKKTVAEAVGEENAEATTEALIAQAEGKDLTDEEAARLQQLDDAIEAAEAPEEQTAEAPAGEELPAFGANEAYQMGLSGRREEELKDTLAELGAEMTGDIQRAYDRGRAELAQIETDRINKVQAWNAGQDGTRVGVVRSIKPEEAEKAKVGMVSGEYAHKERRAIEALRGLAEATGVNMVLFESNLEDGERTGANGWYDRDTRTVYLDIYSGKGNEKAMLRTASHELTHFIQDWSPASYKQFRDFLLDYYYAGDRNAIKKLIQEQMDKDSTLTEPQAMDEVVADASEMMLDGDEEATRKLADDHPRLFVRIKNWIDRWAKALTSAFRGTEPSSAASRMLRDSAETFKEAQRMWWTALEEASVAHRGEIRAAEIEAEREEKRQRIQQKRQEAHERTEKARQEAMAKIDAAQTAEEGQAAIQEAKAVQQAAEAQETAFKAEEKKVDQEAKEKRKDADKITKAGIAIEKKAARLSGEAREYVSSFATEHGIAMDGSQQTGTALIKEALHYYNQGKAGLDFNPNTEAGKGEYQEFARKMNEYGKAEWRQGQLEAIAEEAPEQATTEEQKAATDEQMLPEAEQKAATDEQKKKTEGQNITPSTPKATKNLTEEQARNYIENGHIGPHNPWDDYTPTEYEYHHIKEHLIPAAKEFAAKGTQTAADAIKKYIENHKDTPHIELLEELKKYHVIALQNIAKRTETDNMGGQARTEAEATDSMPTKADNMPTETDSTPKLREIVIDLTPKEEKALETHAQTAQKMDDILGGMSKKAKALVMKWAGNEQINLKMEDGSERAIQFEQFAKKWYDAGREGTPRNYSLIEPTLRNLDGSPVDKGIRPDEADLEWPEFLQDDFYNQGKADAEAAKKPKKQKGAKKNEKPADKGTETGTDNRRDQAGRLLEGVPAENVQENGGERRTVSGAQEQGRANVRNDAEPDGTGPVRERGQGVSERDHVRHGAGEVTEETQAEAEPKAEQETPEEEQARATEEALEEKVEETETYLEAETPKGTNYVIGDSLNIAKSTSEKARYQANVEAIRLLKKLEAENRYATQEEQEILSRYVGWGGLKEAFSDTNPKWKKEYAELLELLTPEEYRAANASILNAHYTSLEVIRAMYEGLRHFGFQGGRMLEPSGGIGHFIGAMPVDMQQSVKSWTMVELDSITGRIAQKLYPNADIRIQGFQDAEIGDGIMDVAIGNVPFGDYEIYDKAYPKLKEYIHNYFFVKSIDKVRPGGLLMFITSHGTMDSRATAVRSILAKKADLLGAVRMPNTAFKGNANTEVVTDILVFRRREDGTPYKGEKFEEIRWLRTEDGKYAPVSEYFMNHPDMILGKTTMQGTMYRGKGEEMTVEARPGDIGKQIVEAMNKINGGMDYRNKLTVEQVQKAAAKARKQTKKNGFEVREGKLYQRTEQGIEPVEMAQNEADRIIGALSIRDVARELQELQKSGAPENEKTEKRAELNRLYDAFEKKYGAFHNKTNQKLILEDPDGYFILSLENFDKKSKKTSKADIFSKDTIAPVVTVNHADTAADAAAISINEKGYIDIARAAELLGVTEDAAEKAMIDGGIAYLNDKGTPEAAATYLSGDVRAKLRMARRLATVDKRYQKNVEALEKIIPEDVKREEIKLRPGQTWIPNAVYEQFICEILGQSNTAWKKHIKVAYDPFSGKYTIEADDAAKYSYGNTKEWGTKDYTFLGIMDNLMNSKEGKVTYKDQEGRIRTDADATKAVAKQAEKIIDKFQQWMWQDETRARQMETLYNDMYNTLVTPKYNGDGLTIAGANAGKQLRPHQRNMVQRIVQGGGNVLIAHCVGAGKTAEMAGAAMKLRQLGIVNKPVFVVPKALVGQWAQEFLDFFPAAKVMALGQNDFTPKNRKEFANRITTGDYDAVIMSYQQFQYIEMTPENQRTFYQNQIDQITEAIEAARQERGKKSLSERELESTKKKLEAQLAKLEDAKKDEAGVYFEDMGIDSLFVDEAHYYKKLFFRSSMGRIKGVGDGSGNKTTYDMYQKIKWLQKMNGGSGIVFATATPVMNSMSETYNMQRYLQEDKLEQIGIRSFDAWASMFGDVTTKSEMGVTGKMEEHKIFSKFKNMPELQKLIQSFMDVLTVEDLQETMRSYGQELKIPKMKGGKRIVIQSERSPFQAEYLQRLDERAQAVKRNPKPQKGGDNMAVISMDGRKMSYTQHMIDPKLPYEEGCKIIKCVDNVAQIWKESAANKGTQIVFLDMGVPKAGGTEETDTEQETKAEGTEIVETKESAELYKDIKRMLIAKGVPAEEIAFISDAGDDPQKKQALYKKVKEGTVRVLIGSTGKMGVGMNAQDRVVALHHLDAPWRPGDIEQREGRALRQGNMNDEVAVYVYVTNDTFDTYMWQTLEWKANVTHNVMNGSNTAREIDGDSEMELSIAEIKAVSQSNPLIKEQFEVGNKIRELEALEREYIKERYRARDNIADNEAKIEHNRQLIPKIEADAKTAEAALKAPFSMKIDGKRYTERAQAAKPLLDAVKELIHKWVDTGVKGEKKIGEFGGFTLYATERGIIHIKGETIYSAEINFDSDTGTMTRLMNQIKDIPNSAESVKKSIERMEEENKKSAQKAQQPFDGAEELKKLRERKAEIDALLNPTQDQAGVASMSEDEEGEEDQEEKRVKYSRREALADDIKASDGTETHYGDHIKFSRRVTDKKELEFLDKQGTIKTYKTMQLVDGKLYPPMAAVVAGGMEDYSVLGQWEKATEHPELIKDGNKFTLNKGKGQGSLAAAYNPYMHSSNLMINDQFSGAYGRPNLVTVECEVPQSEETSGYHAEYAKDTVGWHAWHTGTVASKIRAQKGKERKVFLSRWIKPVRIVPDSEVAKHYAELLAGTNIQVPDNVVYPSLLQELEKAGVPIETTGKIKRSTRDPEDLSDRQLLARAYEGIASTDKEREALARYKELIAQLDADTAKVKELKRQYHDKTFVKGQVDRVAALKIQKEYRELETKIAKTDKVLLNMQRSAALKNVLEVEKKAAVRKAEEKIRTQVERYHEGVNKREYAVRIKKTTERLAKWIAQPNQNNHVPKALRASVAKFLLSIEQGYGTKFTGAGGERRERNFLENMRELQDIVNNISSYQMRSAEDRVEEDFGAYIDLPDGFAEQMAWLIDSVEKTMRETNGAYFNVDALTAEQAKTMYQVLCTISSSITHANEFLNASVFKHVDDAALNTIRYIRSQGKVDYLKGGQVYNFTSWENLQPVRAFERFGAGGEEIFKGLMRGQATLGQNAHEVLLLTNEEYAKKHGKKAEYTAREAREWSEQIRTFHVGDKEVIMPVADVMSLYCLLKRGQAIGHIFGEGFRVADFKDRRGKLISGSGVTLSAEEAAEIVGTLTDRQREVADRMQNIMSTMGSEWGNYVSMKRFGYDMFTEKNYFPIEVDKDRLLAKTDESRGNELYRLLNISSVKPITPGARNRIMIKNIFEVFSSHMSDMAQYNAFGLPVLDAIKWINWAQTEEEDHRMVWVDSIRNAAREMYGNKAGRYIIELLKDVSGTQATGDMGEIIGKNLLMRFNRQAVGANLSVALKQPLSIVRAAMELGSTDLLRGAVGNQGTYKQNVSEMLEYSGIARWKDLGFYDVNVSRPLKNLIMNRGTAIDKILDKATWLAEKQDKVTWAAIWGACKSWVRQNGGSFDTTDAFLKAVADKFEEVIYRTQVVDSILTRSQFMRGTSFLSKSFSSFMSEPTTSYNQLLEAWWQFRNDMRKGMNAGQAIAKHRNLIMRTTAVYVVSAAVMTILEAAIGAWRDDDDYETFMEKFSAGLLDNFVDEILPFNLLPVVSDVYEYAKKLLGKYVLPDEWGIDSFAGGSSPIYSALDTFMSAADVWDKIIGGGNSNYTLYGAIYKTMNALSQGIGVPVAPAMREAVAIWNNTVAAFVPEMRLETYESTVKQGATALYRAMANGDKDREALVRRQLAANGADQKKVNEAIRALIKADRTEGRITAETAEEYLRDMAGMEKNDAYNKVQEWAYEENHDDQWSKYTRLEEALLNGQDAAAAIDELTEHGTSEKDVQTKVRAIITEQTGKQKTMTPTKAEQLLKQYGGMDANEAWIRAQELTYQARTGVATTVDIAMVIYAIERRSSPKAAIDGLLEHGKDKKSIASSLTSKYKEQYLQLRKTDVSEAARLKGQLISIYEYLGYDGKKKVEEWEGLQGK